jgi:hypothetical protein
MEVKLCLWRDGKNTDWWCVKARCWEEYLEFKRWSERPMKNIIVWDVKPYCQIEIHRRLGGKYCFCLQCRRVRQESNQKEVNKVFTCCLFGFLFDPEDGRNMFLRNIGKLSYYMESHLWRFYCWESLLWEPQISQMKCHWGKNYNYFVKLLLLLLLLLLYIDGFGSLACSYSELDKKY